MKSGIKLKNEQDRRELKKKVFTGIGLLALFIAVFMLAMSGRNLLPLLNSVTDPGETEDLSAALPARLQRMLG